MIHECECKSCRCGIPTLVGHLLCAPCLFGNHNLQSPKLPFLVARAREAGGEARIDEMEEEAIDG